MTKMTVRQMMKTPARVVHPRTTLVQAREEMTQARIHHLPVVDAAGTLVGMISERDVDRAMSVMAVVEGSRQTLTVGDIVSGRGLCVGPEQPLHEAATLLIEEKIDGLPVVEGSGTVVGVLTSTDLLEVAREALLGVEPARRARA